MRPPRMVDSRVRWQASTVPARVLAIVASTVPRVTSTALTATGWGRRSQATVPAPRPTTSSATRPRRSQTEEAFGAAALIAILVGAARIRRA